MATTYRAVIKTDEHAKRDQIAFNWSRTVKRGSATTDKAMLGLFVESLASQIPMGPNAEAWFERSSSSGLKTLVRCKGVVTAKRPGRDGHSLVASGGAWVTDSGEVLAHAGH